MSFSITSGAKTVSEIDAVIKNFTDRLYHKRNAHNLRAFVQSFRNRTELTHDELNALRPHVLLVTGKEASFNHTVSQFLGQVPIITCKRFSTFECVLEDVCPVLLLERYQSYKCLVVKRSLQH